jgi:hypothetical protein
MVIDSLIRGKEEAFNSTFIDTVGLTFGFFAGRELIMACLKKSSKVIVQM